jgi:hypothetical protein
MIPTGESMNRHRALLASLVACLCGLAGTRAVTLAQAPTSANPIGVWDAVLTLDGLEHDLSITIARTDSTFTGTIYDACWVTRDRVCAHDGSAPLQKIRVAGDTLSFSIPELSFTGVVNGNRMKSTITFTGDRSPYTFTAIRH